MAVAAGPDIVEDGLAFSVDAANERSYPGSGTTWYDLSGNGYEGTLTNGPIHSTNSQGYFSLDRTNDYCDFGDLDILGGASSATWEAWIKPGTYSASPSTWRSVITTWNDGNDSNPTRYGHTWVFDLRYQSYAFHLRTTETGTYPPEYSGGLTEHFPDNQWAHYVATYDGSNIRIYVNTELVRTASKTGNIAYKTSLEKLKIGVDRNTTAPFGGDISVVNLYRNKALTAAEVQQNYVAIKSRYGL